MQEIWKDITGFSGMYQVSNLGRIKSLKRVVPHPQSKTMTIPERILKPNTVAFGYQQVTLRNQGNRTMKYVHVLVAQEFIGAKPKGYEVNHIDEDKTNNKLSNLEYLTAKENNNYGTRIQRVIAKNTNGKKSRSLVGTHITTGRVIKFPSTAEAKRNGYTHAGSVARGERKTCKGYIFKFE